MMPHTKSPYRLGLDLGSNSIGFSLVALESSDSSAFPLEPFHLGVRIFSDGREAKTNTSLAVERRVARGMRRRRDRLIRRKQQLMETLIAKGLMPEDADERKKLELLDLYELRKRGLDEKLSAYEIGRALFHINQRRGFKSNRKQTSKDNEEGAIKEAIAKLRRNIEEAGFRTYGEFLYQNSTKRIRNTATENTKTLYEFYPLRAMLEEEANKLLTKQQTFHPALLTDEMIRELSELIFHQRKLLPVKKGRCSLLPDEERAYAALPSSQRFRILKEVNNLKILDRIWRRNRDDLSDEQREKVISELHKKKTGSFDGLRKSLKLDSATVFNLESENRTKLGGALTHIALSNKDCFGPLWETLSLEQQDEVVLKLLDDRLEDKMLSDWLEQTYDLPPENIRKIMDTPLEDGTMKFSTKAIHQLMPHLENGLKEYDAITACGWDASNRYTGEIVGELPYYGSLLESRVGFGTHNQTDPEEKRYGKIANPTVHIVLNQVRKLVNELIETYGHPTEIAVELSRELKLNKDEKAERDKALRENTKANERYNEQIEEANHTANARNRLRMKLYEQQDCTCAYSGKAISISQLLSDEVEIDHILPFSRTLDDTTANKVVVFREYNRTKRNKSPYEAFGHQDYDTLLASIEHLPPSKRWRFQPDAMERFEEERNSGDAGWLARQLNDTSYMARVVAEYLRYVVGDKPGTKSPAVDTYPGGMTAKLRRGWGWNKLLPEDPEGKEKNRTDHRHHAIDALVIACANRSLMKRISDASAKGEIMDENWVKDLTSKAPPYLNYDEIRLKKLVGDIVISFKPDHKTVGQGDSGPTSSKLHEETFYGKTRNQQDVEKGKMRLVVRKPLIDLKEKDIRKIRDPLIRRDLAYAIDQRPAGEKIEDTLRRFATERNISRVRVLEEKSETAMRGIKDRQGKPYRYVATGGNHHVDIFCPIKDSQIGKKKYKTGKWYAEVVSHFDANQRDFTPEWRTTHPTAKLVMRLHINDMVAYDEDGERVICRVKKIVGPTQRIYLTPHLVAHEKTDTQSWGAYANGLLEKNARKISVSPAGKVQDPGHAPMPKPLRKGS